MNECRIVANVGRNIVAKTKIFLETMIVATIVMIVVTIKKIAKFGNFTG